MTCEDEYKELELMREKEEEKKALEKEKRDQKKELNDNITETNWKLRISEREGILKEQNIKQKKSETELNLIQGDKSKCEGALESMPFKIGDARDKCRNSNKEILEIKKELDDVEGKYNDALKLIRPLYNKVNELESMLNELNNKKNKKEQELRMVRQQLMQKKRR